MKTINITIGGNSYTLTAPDARQSQELLEFAAKSLPDPIDEVLETANKLPEGAVRDGFLSRHLDRAFEAKKLRGKLNDPDNEQFFKSEKGVRKMVAVMFAKYHPNLTEEKCLELVEQALSEHGPDYFERIKRDAEKMPLKEEQVEQLFTERRG